ncbi:EAL domain-containing protein [Sulfurimonas sp.]|uniref:EAL domain-containing protein n=1 Tax=Sulfurimonas sp. TaxID=2022749 RepID=UPI003567013B
MSKTRVWNRDDLDVIDVAMAVLSPVGSIVLFNRCFGAIFDDKNKGISGKNWFEFSLSSEQKESAVNLFERAVSGEESAIDELQKMRITEKYESDFVTWEIFVLRNKENSIEGALCVGINSTKQIEAQNSLTAESEEQRALNSILSLSLENISLKEQLERALGILLSLSWLTIRDTGGIFLVDKQSDTLILTVEHGLHPALLTMCARVPFGHCLCGRAAATKEIQYACCLDKRHETTYDGIQPHGHYNIPIISQNVVLGVIVLYLTHGYARDERELMFLNSVANTLAGLIERYHVQDALSSSLEKLEQAQTIAHLGGWEWDTVENKIYFSDEAMSVMGSAEFQKVMSLEKFMEIIYSDDRATVQEAAEAGFNGDDFSLDYRIVQKDGSVRSIHTQAKALFDADGKITIVTGTMLDITKRKEMEDKLRLSATVFENTTEGVIITDADRKVISTNRTVSDITGYKNEEIIQKPISILKSERHDEEFYSDIWEVVAKTGSWQGEIWNKRKNGEIYPQWLNISVVKNANKEISNYVWVFSDISAIKESQQKLDHLAHHDPLTGLPNRLLLDARMTHSLSRARRNKNKIAVMFLDLDHFKNVNDTLGHPVGDLLLQEVASRLSNCVREEDTVCRQGGDEFIVILEELHDSHFASDVAQKIIFSLAQKYNLQGHEVFVTCSIGISLYPDDSEDITTLYKNADSALYRAKAQGRNAYQYYTDELTRNAMKRMQMENGLRNAIGRNELVLYYQPLVDLYSGQIAGMEALIRWQHPVKGLMEADDFIPLAEETGLIIHIGEWVLRSACTCLKSWIDNGLAKLKMSVNISSVEFNQKNFSQTVAKILSETGLKGEYLELELTERIVMKDAQNTVIIMEELKKLGVSFSIDDFGTGYSSLSYLKKFPISKIKIDKSFVNNITTDSEDAAISQAVISMSHSMHLRTVAEGVESLEQQEFLRSRQCDEIQGYYFSHPLPEAQIRELLDNGSKIDIAKLQKKEKVLLIVDDNKTISDKLEHILQNDGYKILHAYNSREALKIMATNNVHIIVVDQDLSETDGVELLRKVRKLYSNTIRVLLTSYNDPKIIARAVNESAVHKIISKSLSNDELMLKDIRAAFIYAQGLV